VTDDEQAVKAKWPDAWVTPKMAQNTLFGGDFWVWHDNTSSVTRDYQPLGKGATQAEAWADAARRMKQ
jgi:hypothetical protein